jgi:ABC-2 type transport system permease protein
MLSKIAAFELRYQLHSPLFVVGFLIFFLLSFGAITIDEIQIGGRGNVNLNSPFAILQTIGILNLFAIFVITAFVANVVIRDDETGFASILRSTQISKFDYLVGRFSGAMLVAIIIMLSVPLGTLVGSWMPWIDQEKVGALVPTHYLYGLLFFSFPTLLLIGALFFSLATATRSLMWTYVGVVAFLVLYFTSRVMLREPSLETIGALTDPFGLSALGTITKYWTTSDRNTLLPPISGLLLYNRLIWLGVAMAFFCIAYALFKFEVKVKVSAPSKQDKVVDTPIEAIHRALAGTADNHQTRAQQFTELTRFDMRFVFKSSAFFVLLALGLFNSLGGLWQVVDVQGTPYFPVSRAIINVLEGAFSMIPLIIAIYYAGELVWRDRDQRIHEIVDATAAPDWAFVVPKVLAISLVLAATYVVAALAGVLFQLYHGYTQIEPVAYALWFVLPGVIGAFLLAVLAIFVQALVPHKYVGWAIMLVYLVASITLNTMGFEHNLYNYGASLGVPTSDMNGLGRFWIGRAWFHAYWTSFAIMLLVGAHFMWRRGAETRLRPRFARLSKRLVGVPWLIFRVAAVAFVGLGGFIYYNTNILNEYRTSVDSEKKLAEYEKQFLAFEKLAQPKVSSVNLAVELFPKQARAQTTGTYIIENRSKEAISQIHLRWIQNLKIDTLEITGAVLDKDYAKFNYRIYKFGEPMQPGEKRQVSFVTVLQEQGFPNSGGLTDIVDSGTFLNNASITPMIGMDRNGLLTDRSKRRKLGLPADLRPPKLEDTSANDQQYIRTDSDWVDAQISVTTDADQTPIAPGYTVSDQVKGNRRMLVTRTEAPIMHFFSIQSARYAIKQDVWKGADGKDVNLQVYYHPPHAHNTQRMIDAMKTSMQLYSQKFSPYQFKQARIIEFPSYASFAQAFANTMPYSESIGFVQNFDDKKSDEKIDLVTYVTAHEMAHQWWAHQVIGANKQGMTLMSESFAQYSALLVMEHLYGKEQVRKFLKRELDSYLRNRGGEAVEELPLVRVENQGYIHYSKGGLIMFWLKEVVGQEVVNRALQKLLTQYAFKPAPYPSASDFIQILRAEAGPEHNDLITDLFEKITIYDMKAVDATATKNADGKFTVTFTVDAKKLYADGQGKETESPLNEMFEIGVFTEEPGKKGYTSKSVLLSDRRVFKSGKQPVSVVVDQLPKFVGIDPYNKRIDRNSDDNLVVVSVAGSAK